MNVTVGANTLLGAALYGFTFIGVAFFLSRFIRRLERRLESHLTDTTGYRSPQPSRRY